MSNDVSHAADSIALLAFAVKIVTSAQFTVASLFANIWL